MIINGKEYLTIKECADFIGTSKTTIRAWILNGKLSTINTSPKRFFIAKEDIENGIKTRYLNEDDLKKRTENYGLEFISDNGEISREGREVTFKCYCGEIHTEKWEKLRLKKRKCSNQKRTIEVSRKNLTENFVKVCEEKGYKTNEIYSGIQTLMSFECEKCGHEFKAKAQVVIYGECACPKCQMIRWRQSRIRTYEEVKQICLDRNFEFLPSKEEYYTLAPTKKRNFKIKCLKCSVVTTRRGGGLKKCVCKECIRDAAEKSRGKKYTVRQKMSSQLQKWKKEVIKMNGDYCNICECSTKIQAHHLSSFHCDEENRLNPLNGIPLCKFHHKGFHHEYGRKNNTKDQYDKYKEKTLRLMKIEECYQLAKEFLP
jgi:excisionase family DNA binding protein